jgi:hypothetical protein
VRQAVGYALAAVAGALFTVVVFLLASNAGGPVAGHNLSRCIAGGSYGWIGAGLIVVVVGGLALYLGRLGDRPDEGGTESVQARCVSCGHVVSPDWKICPHCGGLAGRTRHAAGSRSGRGE